MALDSYSQLERYLELGAKSAEDIDVAYKFSIPFSVVNDFCKEARTLRKKLQTSIYFLDKSR